MRSVEEVGRGVRVDLGIKLFKNSVSVSLRREARLGLARLVSSRLGSSHFQNFSDKKKWWWYIGHVGRAGRGVGGSGGRRGS